jgi:DNA-binding transcriptional ArsR family regulator
LSTDRTPGLAGPSRTDEVFSALADPNRRLIIERLAAHGPATATELAARIGVSRQGAAKHLAGLAEAGIVSPSRQGREVRYELVEQSLEPGAEWIQAVGGKWDERFASLKRHLDD